MGEKTLQCKALQQIRPELWWGMAGRHEHALPSPCPSCRNSIPHLTKENQVHLITIPTEPPGAAYGKITQCNWFKTSGKRYLRNISNERKLSDRKPQQWEGATWAWFCRCLFWVMCPQRKLFNMYILLQKLRQNKLDGSLQDTAAFSKHELNKWSSQLWSPGQTPGDHRSSGRLCQHAGSPEVNALSDKP